MSVLPNSDELKGQWKQQVGAAKVAWGKLTDDEILQTEGHTEKLSGLVQERYGIVRSEASLIGQDIQTVNLIPMRNIPVTFMPPAPPEFDDTPDPIPAARAITTKAKSGSDAPSSAKDKARPPAKRVEPPKPKETPKDEGTGILKRFRIT